MSEETLQVALSANATHHQTLHRELVTVQEAIDFHEKTQKEEWDRQFDKDSVWGDDGHEASMLEQED